VARRLIVKVLGWVPCVVLYRAGGQAGGLAVSGFSRLDCTMHLKNFWTALVVSCLVLAASGCAVSRGQESVGAYIDDAGITALVKSRFFEDKDVAGSAISVETLKGTVLLSGFAKNTLERNKAETIARGVKGVTSVRNEIAVRP
jgi:hypothetical protein